MKPNELKQIAIEINGKQRGWSIYLARLLQVHITSITRMVSGKLSISAQNELIVLKAYEEYSKNKIIKDIISKIEYYLSDQRVIKNYSDIYLRGIKKGLLLNLSDLNALKSLSKETDLTKLLEFIETSL